MKLHWSWITPLCKRNVLMEVLFGDTIVKVVKRGERWLKSLKWSSNERKVNLFYVKTLCLVLILLDLSYSAFLTHFISKKSSLLVGIFVVFHFVKGFNSLVNFITSIISCCWSAWPRILSISIAITSPFSKRYNCTFVILNTFSLAFGWVTEVS